MNLVVTDKHQRLWEEQGYLLLPQVLSRAATTQLLEKVDAVLESCDKEQLFSQQSAEGLRSGGALDEDLKTFKIAGAITQTDALLERMTPRRRRLFGDLGEGVHPSSYFYPDPDEQLRLMLDDGDAPPR